MFNMNENFKKLEFEQRESIMQEISRRMEEFYIIYRDKLCQYDSKIAYNYGEIHYIIEKDDYTTSFVSTELYKNGVRYDLKTELKSKINDRIIEVELQKIVNEIDSIETLKSINSIKEIRELKNELIYTTAVKSYDEGKFKDAIDKFNELESTYKNAKEYIGKAKTLSNIQGTYRKTAINIAVINGWNITFGVDPMYDTTNYFDQYTYKYKIENNQIILEGEIALRAIGNGITQKYKIDEKNKRISSNTGIYYYESNKVDFPKRREEPKIGMTKSQVENSTWGKPNKINRTTTKYGIHEQWVYDNHKYLYFDDGILTSIQD